MENWMEMTKEELLEEMKKMGEQKKTVERQKQEIEELQEKLVEKEKEKMSKKKEKEKEKKEKKKKEKEEEKEENEEKKSKKDILDEDMGDDFLPPLSPNLLHKITFPGTPPNIGPPIVGTPLEQAMATILMQQSQLIQEMRETRNQSSLNNTSMQGQGWNTLHNERALAGKLNDVRLPFHGQNFNGWSKLVYNEFQPLGCAKYLEMDPAATIFDEFQIKQREAMYSCLYRNCKGKARDICERKACGKDIFLVYNALRERFVADDILEIERLQRMWETTELKGEDLRKYVEDLEKINERLSEFGEPFSDKKFVYKVIFPMQVSFKHEHPQFLRALHTSGR
jgi:hypothetical protein